MSKRKLKAPKAGNGNGMQMVHDRRANLLPVNAAVRAIVVDDPYEVGAKITAIASLRDDPLAKMHGRRIIDDAQLGAGRHWQRLFRESEIGPLKAMDTTKEPVDGGQFVDPYTDRHRKAIMELARVHGVLGMEGEAIIRDVLGGPMCIEDASRKRGLKLEREIQYLGRRFRECLETLARQFGFA